MLDMGEPVKIVDLARKMIELSGLDVKDAKNLEGDIEIEEIGLRPGEKLYEELLITGLPDVTIHPRIFKSHEEYLAWEVLEHKLSLIQQAIESNDQEVLVRLLQGLVTGYSPEALKFDNN